MPRGVRQPEAEFEERRFRIVWNVFKLRAQLRAVTGLDATLRALRQGRIWRLVYADGFAPSGSRCANCAMLFDERPESCAYCGAAVWPVYDLVEQAAQRVVVLGGKIEQVRGDNVERLRGVGGIGAFLKF